MISMSSIPAMAPALSQVIVPVTVIHPRSLSDCLDLQLTIAGEAFQHTGSFKFRAAYNLALQVPQREIIAASSGNFGQALAYACQFLKTDQSWDAMLCPVGGGGLISGIATGPRRAGNETEVLGAEPALANDAARSLRAGQIIANQTEPAIIQSEVGASSRFRSRTSPRCSGCCSP
jgi:threonine dehydratase